MSTPPSQPPPDEISLRELYLVVRRSALAIALVALALGVAAGALTALRPTSYSAEATTAVSRTPVSVQQEFGMAFRPELDVPFDTYQTLAFSRGVIERVLADVPESGIIATGAREAFTLERLAGAANQPSSLLAVAHRVRHRDAEASAALASRWAAVTIETVRALLNENLDAVERITSDSLAQARVALEAAEAEVRLLREGQDGLADPQRLFGAYARLNDLDVRADELARLIRGREAEAASLAARLNNGADEVVVLTDAPDVPLTLEGAVWATEARLATLRAEHETIEVQRGTLRADITALTRAAARFEADLMGVQRARDQAQRAFEGLLVIEPTIAYVAQLAPTGARVLSDAAVPTRPEPRRMLLTAVLTTVVVGFGGVVLVLLREAVKDPAPVARAGAPVAAAEPVVGQPG